MFKKEKTLCLQKSNQPKLLYMAPPLKLWHNKNLTDEEIFFPQSTDLNKTSEIVSWQFTNVLSIQDTIFLGIFFVVPWKSFMQPKNL